MEEEMNVDMEGEEETSEEHLVKILQLPINILQSRSRASL